MEVKRLPKNRQCFSNLICGDVFKTNDDIYFIKIPTIDKASRGYNVVMECANAISLANGQDVFFCENTEVEWIKGSFVEEE